MQFLGLNMELITMDIPVGRSITRISRTPKLEFPTTLNTVAVDFFPLLEATWKGKEVMKASIKALDDRKRKAIELTTQTDKSSVLPPSFVRICTI